MASGFNIKSDEKNQEQNLSNDKPQIKYTTEGNLIENDYYNDQNSDLISLPSLSKPDLIIEGYRAAWGYNWFYFKNNGTFLHISVKNDGATYRSETTIKVILAFFIDSATTPSYKLTATPLFDPYEWRNGQSLEFGWFFISKEPESLTVKVDYTNVIEESNESNNEETCVVYPVITIEGTVHRKVSETLIPCEEAYIIAGRLSKTDENGYYAIGEIPKMPFNEPDTVSVRAGWGNYQDVTKRTDPVLPGDKTTLNFVLDKEKSKEINFPLLVKFLDDHLNLFQILRFLICQLNLL
jgi:hypothetical protein